jgi:hypothetical protein
MTLTASGGEMQPMPILGHSAGCPTEKARQPRRIDESSARVFRLVERPFQNCQRGTLVLHKDGDATVRLLCSHNDAIGNVIVTFGSWNFCRHHPAALAWYL